MAFRSSSQPNDEQINELYPDVERVVEGLLDRGARRLNRRMPQIPVADAKQEARMAVLSALPRYDGRKATHSVSGLKRYLSRVITNTFKCLCDEQLTQSRIPYVSVREDQGWIRVPKPVASYETLRERPEGARWEPVDERATPEQQAIEEELSGSLEVFKMRLRDELGEREQVVFDNCVSEIGVPQVELAQQLGVTKNALDWSIHQVRKAATKLARQPEFSATFGSAVEGRGWPRIHLSRESDRDHSHVREVMRQRRLSSVPVLVEGEEYWDDEAGPLDEDGMPYWSRRVYRYPWGMILMIRKGSKGRTLVVEGCCNLNTGEVYGAAGPRESIPVAWYLDLVKAVRDLEVNNS